VQKDLHAGMDADRITQGSVMDYPGRNPWMVLGLTEDASPAQIRRAFHQQVRRAHPDAGGRAEHFIAVKAAYDALRDATARDEMSGAVGVETRQPDTSPYDRWLQPTGPARSWGERSTRPTAVAYTSPTFSELLQTELTRMHASAA